MKNLTDLFDRVYVINCAHRPDRLEDTKKHLEETKMADNDKVHYYPAIIGDWTTCPADWRSGKGAWGCLRSHQRILEDVLHTRDDRGQLTLDNVLIMEDDIIFKDKALQKLNEFMEVVPDDWGQIYLGGQHRRTKVETSLPNVVIGKSVNRTHAYAVNKPTFEELYRHISYASDYRKTTKHIDHQLELAHRREDWKVYCPKEWIVGQRAGSSNINGRVNKTKFWQEKN
jgi:GR25 family glycosyltransferase involved in LPS biosynthesis